MCSLDRCVAIVLSCVQLLFLIFVDVDLCWTKTTKLEVMKGRDEVGAVPAEMMIRPSPSQVQVMRAFKVRTKC